MTYNSENIAQNNQQQNHMTYGIEFIKLVEMIKAGYPAGGISEPEAAQAARNLIEFVGIINKYEGNNEG